MSEMMRQVTIDGWGASRMSSMPGLAMALSFLVAATGCVSTGQMGIMSRSGADVVHLITEATPYEEIGEATARVCRHFLLNAVPYGNSDMSTAVDQALSRVNGDALLNATVSNSLFGFIPLYGLYTFSCSAVRGTAIRFVATPDAEEVTQ